MNLNPRQEEAVNHGDGPLLIVAGAGSGKTKTLTSRLARLIERGVPGKSIIAITFTNKAADEMRDRITNNRNSFVSHQSSVMSYPFIGTFHAFGAKILRAEAALLGRTPAYTIFDDDDSLSILKRILRGLDWNLERYKPAKVLAQINKVKNKLLDPGEIFDARGMTLFKNYESALREANVFDFGDLIEKPTVLFHEHPAVLKKYEEVIHHVLVDEYQDVNPAQYELVRLLAEKRRNIAVVGDDAQAIYGWRYADFKNFLNFENDWHGAKIVVLDQNYRSSGTIITGASAVISGNVLQRPKKLWTENPSGEPIRVVAAPDAEEEAAYIGHEINNSKTLSTAILYRTNAQSRAIEQALIVAQIPYRIYGGVRFYERKEIKDIVAGLRFAANPKDVIAAERISKNFPKSSAETLLKALPELGASRSLPEIISFFLATTQYLSRLEKEYQNAPERIENVKELIAFAGTFKTLPEFLERVTLMQATDHPTEASANQNLPVAHRHSLTPVTVMTIHMAKGLEFDHVFIAGAAEGLLPHQMAYGTKESLEEERRLMYVAMTRARHALTITFTHIPSRFIYEIPPELTEFINLTTNSHELPDEDIVYLDE
jgi:DNA helicase-2/ATP-dependent DNA helicase PcrA